MQEVERWLFQVWKFFENSPKRLAAYMKIPMSVKQLQEPSKEAKDKCLHRLAKATRTRWLSLGKAIEGVHKDYILLVLTLKHFEEQDAQASGMLGKMHKAKFIGIVTVMNHILPVLNRLSCAFQQGRVSSCIFSQHLRSALMTWRRFYRQKRLLMNSKVICHQMADLNKLILLFQIEISCY